jgi:hypothetical protein
VKNIKHNYSGVRYRCRNKRECQEMACIPKEAKDNILKELSKFSSVSMAYFVMKSEISSNRPRFGTLLWTSFFTPLDSPTGTALMA